MKHLFSILPKITAHQMISISVLCKTEIRRNVDPLRSARLHGDRELFFIILNENQQMRELYYSMH